MKLSSFATSQSIKIKMLTCTFKAKRVALAIPCSTVIEGLSNVTPSLSNGKSAIKDFLRLIFCCKILLFIYTSLFILRIIAHIGTTVNPNMQKRATFCDYHRKSDTYAGQGSRSSAPKCQDFSFKNLF